MGEITLYPYQEELVSRAENIVKQNGKVGLDVYTKGGKSFMSYALAERLLKDEDNNAKILVCAPKRIISNLKNIWRDMSLKNKMIFVNTEMLSRGHLLTDIIESNGVSVSDVKIAIFDESHVLYGKCIQKSLLSNKVFLDNIKIIAVTATPEDTILNMNKLAEFVGKENIVQFKMEEAIAKGIAKRTEYIPCVLSYSKASMHRLEELSKTTIKSAYIVEQINRLTSIVNSLGSNIFNTMYRYMLSNSPTYSCASGARVMVFFNKVEDVKTHKDTVVDLVTTLYKAWGNEINEVNYLEYTSHNTAQQDDEVNKVIGSKAKPGVIDIISTVNKGVESIHLDKIQLGLIMCGTQSLKRYIQMMGRFTMNSMDEDNTTVFDFKDNRSFLGNKTISVGKVLLENRRNYRRRVLRQFHEDRDMDFGTSCHINECEHLSTTLSIYDRIEALYEIVEKNHDELIKCLKDNMNIIDNEFNGNIHKFLSSNTQDKEYSKFKFEYTDLQKSLLYSGFEADDEELIKRFKFLGYRVYITANCSTDDENYIKRLYNDINKQLASGTVSTQFKNKYTIDYMAKKMNSSCSSLIQRNEIIEEALIQHIGTLKASAFGVTNKELKSICMKLLTKLNKYKSENTRLSEEDILDIDCTLFYLSNVPVSDNTEREYLDTICKYVEYSYPEYTMIEYWGNKTEIRKGETIIRIIQAMNENNLHKLNITDNYIISHIANKFNDSNIIYKKMLEIVKINTLSDFYNRIVVNTEMQLLIDKADAGDYKALQEVWKRYGSNGEHLPSKLRTKLKNSKVIKQLSNTITKDTVYIEVQSLLKEDNLSSIKKINNAVRKGIVDQDEVISMAFSKSIKNNVLCLIYYMSGDCDLSIEDYTKILMTIRNISASVNIKILDKVSQLATIDDKHKDIIIDIKEAI